MFVIYGIDTWLTSLQLSFFRATKLSGGKNEILTDNQVKGMWPTTKDGRLTFRSKRVRSLDGYLIGSSK